MIFLLTVVLMFSTSAEPRTGWPLAGAIVRTPILPWPDWQPGHRGLDLAADVDDVVHSPIAGTVAWVGEISGRPSVSIAQGQYRHIFHPVTALVSRGDRVVRGQPIARVRESSHCAQTECLHWAVKKRDRYQDPRWTAESRVRRLSPR
jgi:murein DD-endopeptidase MepM/ murein hydrolase activator NlpD